MNSKLLLFRRSKIFSKSLTCARAPHDKHYGPNEPKPHDYEEPPHIDEIIKIHYLKHYPQWEFQNFQDPEIDSYRYWLRYRFEHYRTESSPSIKSPWEETPLRAALLILLMPVIVTLISIPSMKAAHRRKNNKNEILGHFSQRQL
mmetsp:Transcript_20946/g.23308  ORF Transcript_20946/g.23308 Transcript_20946/m.23308 type:complete len:145 (+) Transcript_20946:24-458(+)